MKDYGNLRKIEDQVRRAWRLRFLVYCGRCGRQIEPEAVFTVDRLDTVRGNANSNLAPVCDALHQADARWSNPLPPQRHAGGLLPWWIGKRIPHEVPDDPALLAPW